VGGVSKWKRLLARVEELYQVERAKFDSYTTEDMRAFIIEKQENLTTAVGKVAVGAPRPSWSGRRLLPFAWARAERRDEN
jgi:hypothetical protein